MKLAVLAVLAMSLPVAADEPEAIVISPVERSAIVFKLMEMQKAIDDRDHAIEMLRAKTGCV